MTLQAQELADRYAAAWNQPDTTARAAEIRALWAEDGEHYVKEREVRGYEELYVRVAGSYEKNVLGNGFRFRAVRDAQRLRDVVTFHWEMIRPQTGEVLATGLEVLRLDEEGKILVDYQFVVG